MSLLKRIKLLIKLNAIIWKEVLKGMFNKNSSLVRSCILLITAGKMTEEEIPNVSNLREMVVEVMYS